MTSSAAPPLVLVAASGLAREVLAVLRRTGTHEVVGILDDDPSRHGGAVDGVPVLGPADAVQDHPAADVVLCVGRGDAREALARRLEGLGVDDGRYASISHPSVEVPPSCSVGRGSVLLAGSVLTADVRVGQHVVLMPHVTLTHDVVVDDFATLCAGVSLGGGVHVGRAAYLGMHAAVREHVVVGQGATLGMGAAVLADVPEHQTWVGVPARVLVTGGAGR